MSLLTAARYEAITGDRSTVSVSALADEALDLLEEDLGRPLESAERTERMWPDREGWLWPRAVPITVAAGWTIDGDALRAGTFGVNPWPSSSEALSVTYTGGYVERSTNPDATNRLPAYIERDLAWAVYVLANPDAIQASLPRGATSVSVGDISVSFERGVGGSVDNRRIRWSRSTLRHRRRGL